MFKEFKKFIKKENKVIITLFIITFITYFIKLFFYSISIDTEQMLIQPQEIIKSWYSIGRFTLCIFKTIFNVAYINITLANWISMFLIFLSSIAWIYNFYIINPKKEYSKLSYIILGSTFITCPYVIEQFNFTLQTVEISLCYLLETISFIYINKFIITNNKSYFLITIILNILCMGAYQSFVNIFICCTICSYLIMTKKEKWNLKTSLIMVSKYIFIFTISFLLSQFISKIFSYIILHTISSGKYLSSQILWGKESFTLIIHKLYDFIDTTLKGTGIINLPYYLLITIITLIYTSYKVFKHKLKVTTEYIPIIFLIISPFLLFILLGQGIAYRSLLGFPIVLGFLFFYIINDNKKSYLSKLLIILGIITITHQAIISTKLFINDYKRYQHDVSFAKKINKSLKKYDTTKTVIFLGSKSSLEYLNERERGETIGYSFFEWDQTTNLGSNKRINNFMKTLNYKYKLPTEQEYKKANQYKSQLKIYPDKNSIKETKKYIIIKLSD